MFHIIFVGTIVSLDIFVCFLWQLTLWYSLFVVFDNLAKNELITR